MTVIENAQSTFKNQHKNSTTWVKVAKKTLTDLSSMKICGWKIIIWKTTPHPMSSRKWKSKQQWDTITHLLEWLESRTLKTPNTVEDLEQQEYLSLANETRKMYSLWKRVWKFLVKLKIYWLLSYDSEISLLDIYPRKMKNTFTQKPVRKVYNCFICDSLKLRQLPL